MSPTPVRKKAVASKQSASKKTVAKKSAPSKTATKTAKKAPAKAPAKKAAARPVAKAATKTTTKPSTQAALKPQRPVAKTAASKSASKGAGAAANASAAKTPRPVSPKVAARHFQKALQAKQERIRRGPTYPPANPYTGRHAVTGEAPGMALDPHAPPPAAGTPAPEALTASNSTHGRSNQGMRKQK
jgi:hypothetical protein